MYIANHVVRARLISERVFFYEFLMDFFKKKEIRKVALAFNVLLLFCLVALM